MAPNTAEKNWPGSSVRATWVSQREVFLYPHATHLTNGSFVTKVDPSVVEPFRPEHGSSSFVKTIHLCTKYLRTWSSTLAVCRLLSSDNTEKCIVSLAVSRPTFFRFRFISVSSAMLAAKTLLRSQSMDCQNRNVFSACLPPTACYTILFYGNILTEPNWSQQTKWTLLELSLIIPKWTAISLVSQSLRLFWFLIHFRLSAFPFEAFFLTVCSKPPANPADCSGTDLTGTTDWLTDPDDCSAGFIEAVTRSTMPDKLS